MSNNLIERLEALSEPDRAVDAETAKAVGWGHMMQIDELIARLRSRKQVFPAVGGGHIAPSSAGAYITDNGYRLVNPDGQHAADRIEALTAEVERLQSRLSGK